MTAVTTVPQVQVPGSKPRRGFGFWLKRVLIGTVVVIVGVGIAGAVYQIFASSSDASTYPPLGQMVNVGGHSLHLYCTGQGTPTVILESAAGASLPNWSWIRSQVEPTTRVCAYDRAGIGWSESGPEPRTALTLSHELHSLLENAAIPGPYILVGHSFGGKYVRMFASEYPTEVAGVVLVDASHPEQFSRTESGKQQFQTQTSTARLLPILARLGIVRILNLIPSDPNLPKPAQDSVKAMNATNRFADGYLAEWLATGDSDRQVQETNNLGATPLIVLSAGQHGFPPDIAPALEAEWSGLQAELAALSTSAVQRIYPNATHGSLVTQAGDAQLTSNAILNMVNAIRIGEPLTQ